MSKRKRIADLFCGAGGAGMGLHRAGFEVVGFDINPQPNYPFEFRQADALAVDLAGFDAVWASPPCQRWAGGFVKDRAAHPDLIEATRALLQQSRLPYIIENVPKAPLIDAVTICGGALACMTDQLQIHRHRKFESNQFLFGAPCARQRKLTVSVVGHGTPTGNRITLGRNPSIEEKRSVMGIDWMTRGELSQAIPPAYSEFLGQQLYRTA